MINVKKSNKATREEVKITKIIRFNNNITNLFKNFTLLVNHQFKKKTK